MDQKIQYVCPKCGCQHYEHDQFQASGDGVMDVLDFLIGG